MLLSTLQVVFLKEHQAQIIIRVGPIRVASQITAWNPFRVLVLWGRPLWPSRYNETLHKLAASAAITPEDTFVPEVYAYLLRKEGHCRSFRQPERAGPSPAEGL